MNSKDYLADVYQDFFGSPLVETSEVESSEEGVDIIVIDSFLIEEESKDLLRKIVDYMRRYHEKEVSNYLDFHLLLQGDNKETNQSIEKLMEDAVSHYHYLSPTKLYHKKTFL